MSLVGKADLREACKRWASAFLAPRLGTAHGKAQRQASAGKARARMGTQSVQTNRGETTKACHW